MGVNGCGWVRWGIACMGGHRNKARTDKNGFAGHMSVAVAGDIFPGHHVFVSLTKSGLNGRG